MSGDKIQEIGRSKGLRGRISKLFSRRPGDHMDYVEERVLERGTSGKVFVLAGGGLRHMGRGSIGAPEECETFLGYSRQSLFWKDVFEIAHPDEARSLRILISEIITRPGASASIRVRLQDATSRWRWTEMTVQNVLEAPEGEDGGLLVVNMCDLSRSENPPRTAA